MPSLTPAAAEPRLCSVTVSDWVAQHGAQTPLSGKSRSCSLASAPQRPLPGQRQRRSQYRCSPDRKKASLAPMSRKPRLSPKLPAQGQAQVRHRRACKRARTRARRSRGRCGREHRGDSCARTTLWRRRWRAARSERDDRRSTGDASSRSWRTAKRFRRRRSLSLSACLFTPLQKSAAAESAQRMAIKQSVNFIVKACSSACRRSPTRRSSSDALSAAILVPWRRRSTGLERANLYDTPG